MEEQKDDKKKNLQDLQRFLKQKSKQKSDSAKAEKLTEQEIAEFFDQIVIPAFETLKKTISEYDMGEVKYDKYNVLARLRVVEPLSNFLFKIGIDNDSRIINIKCNLKYKENLRDRLNNAWNNHHKRISFKEIENINQKTIVSIFTEWYTAKDENIRIAKERKQ